MVSFNWNHARLPSHGLLTALWIAVVCLGLGCSQGPEGSTVRGTVTYSGKPLTRGSLLFNPTDTKLPTARAAIQEDGTYELVAAPGDYQIIVTSYTADPPTVAPDHPDYAPPKSAIPSKYSALQTTPLQQTVPSTDAVIDLQL